ncbi:MAG: protein translocase subunit SecD [Magnetospiraceae bacterium]
MLHFEKWKTLLILAVCIVGFALAAPNVVSQKTANSLPSWMPHLQVALGLDLQGGVHLLAEVQVEKALEERLKGMVESVRAEMREPRIRYTGLGVQGDAVMIKITNAQDLDQAEELIDAIDPESTEIVRGDENQLRITFTEAAKSEMAKSLVSQSLEIVRNRIDETGVKEPTIQIQGERRILIQVPGVDDPQEIKDLLGTTAKMTFHFLDRRGSSLEVRPDMRVPPGAEVLPSDDDRQEPYLLVEKRVIVSGENLVDAQPTVNQNGQPVVSFKFDALGASQFGHATQENVGRRLAIVLDKRVISAPVVREAILGGNGQISGNFTIESAGKLALLLRAGALPAELVFLEERSVGPGLGADSIAAGKVASLVGLVAVIGFMVLAYGLFGIFANVALMVNIVLILGSLSILQATLTLPGIAGIVLTIGMAVDANVLIFERIREELRAGRGVISSVDAGYKRAITTILDANVTTLIAAILLFQFGSGPVKGFAVTLAIGIATSLFTATMLTRLMVATWLRRARPKALPI